MRRRRKRKNKKKSGERGEEGEQEEREEQERKKTDNEGLMVSFAVKRHHGNSYKSKHL